MPLTSTIAELMLEKGRAQAAGQIGVANAYAQALQHIGQNVGQTIADIPQQQMRAKLQSMQLQNLQGEADERAARAASMQRDAQAQSAWSQELQNPANYGDDGKVDHQKAADAVSKRGFPVQANAYLEGVQKTESTAQTLAEGRQKLMDAQRQIQQASTNHLGELASVGLSKLDQQSPLEARDTMTGLVANAAAHQLITEDDAGKFMMASAQASPDQLRSMYQGLLDQAPDVKAKHLEQAKTESEIVKNTQTPQVEAAKLAETTRHDAVMEGIGKLNTGREAAAQIETARHNRAMEAIQNPFGALSAGAQGGAAGQSPAPVLSGDDFLKTLPPNLASEVKAYAEGRRPFPVGMSMAKLEPLIQLVGQYDPTFDATNYNARNKARTDLTSPSGTGGKTINALNTAIQHAGTMSDLIEALGNGNLPAANFIANAWNKNIAGGTKVTNYEAVQPQLMKEIERAWRGTGGSQTDIDDLKRTLGPNAGIQQQREALQQFVELMKGKLQTTETQRDAVLGPIAGASVPVLYPQSQPVLDKIEQRASGKPQASADTSGEKTLTVAQVKQMADMAGTSYDEARKHAESKGYVVR